MGDAYTRGINTLAAGNYDPADMGFDLLGAVFGFLAAHLFRNRYEIRLNKGREV